MRQLNKAGVALLAGLAGIGCGGSALGQSTPKTEGNGAEYGTQAPRGEEQGTQRDPHADQGKPKVEGAEQAKPKALGAGVGGKAGCGGPSGGGYNFGPLDTGAVGVPQRGFGAGIGQGGEQGGEQGMPGKVAETAQPAPVPQYWLADASLFVANAGNTAQTLANEQTLGVQAPSVLGNQAQFLLASADRALSSLAALEAHAEATNPRAVPDIRAAIDQLNAAKGQAQQTLDAANAGTLGPMAQGTIRSTYEHLQAAERDMGAVGHIYGAQGFTLGSACNFRGGRGLGGLGAGIGGKPAPAAPQKAAPEKAPEGNAPKAPEGNAPKAPEGGSQP